jgi:hypothetical protein
MSAAQREPSTNLASLQARMRNVAQERGQQERRIQRAILLLGSLPAPAGDRHPILRLTGQLRKKPWKQGFSIDPRRRLVTLVPAYCRKLGHPIHRRSSQASAPGTLAQSAVAPAAYSAASLASPKPM